MDFSFTESVGNSIDIASTAFLRTVRDSELAPDQSADSTNRPTSSSTPKLVSMHENGHRRVGTHMAVNRIWFVVPFFYMHHHYY